MKLLAVHHAQLIVPRGSLAAARDFYLGVLGLEEIPKPEVLAARGGFWAQLGAQQIHVNEEDAPLASRRAHVAYLVDDLEAWRARLLALGLTVQDGEPLLGQRRFEFRDPFDNRVEFLQNLHR